MSDTSDTIEAEPVNTADDTASAAKRTRSMGKLLWMQQPDSTGTLHRLSMLQPEFSTAEAARKWLATTAEAEHIKPATYCLVRVVETVAVNVTVVRQVTLTEAA